MLDFKCPDGNCNKMQAGTTQDMLHQAECRHCFMQLPWAIQDPVIRAKVRQMCKTTTPAAFDGEPPQELVDVFLKKHKITKAEDAAAMLIRAGNSHSNYIVAAGAQSVKQIIQAVKQGARAAAKNMVLGNKIQSMHNAKVVLAIFKLSIEKHKNDKTHGWHIEINEVVSRAASHGDLHME
jgi:hypothetical protein